MNLDKDLVAASATTMVLGILAAGEQHGYGIAKSVADLSDGKVRWSDGMLYPLLHRLERNGWVTSDWGVSEVGRRRKHYAITKAGLKELRDRQNQWVLVNNMLQAVFPTEANTQNSHTHAAKRVDLHFNPLPINV